MSHKELDFLWDSDDELKKHLPGKHDQDDHGRRGPRVNEVRIEAALNNPERQQSLKLWAKKHGVSKKEYTRQLDEHIKEGLKDMPIEVRVPLRIVARILSDKGMKSVNETHMSSGRSKGMTRADYLANRREAEIMTTLRSPCAATATSKPG